MRVENPYQSPDFVPPESPSPEKVDAKPWQPTLRAAFLRWGLICYASALPSFYWAVGMSTTGVHVIAMVCAIFCFVPVYAFLECSPFYANVRKNKELHRTVRIGFGTRIVISVLFPIGMYVDAVLGMLSVGMTGGFSRSVGSSVAFPDFKVEFAWFFVTTIVQGLLVNAAIFIYMVAVLAVQLMFFSMPASESQQL